MPHTVDLAIRHIKAGLLATLTVVALGLPALAVDTGGGGGVPAAAPAPAPSAMAPRATPRITPRAPKARLLDLDDARALIARNDWDGALGMLKVIVVQQPRNADALNLYGRTLREKGRLREAEASYLKALKLRPSHRGANEYLGELYVMTGQMKKAEARLDTLAKLCGKTTCEEYRDLAKAIAAKA
jgi:predicted Zn-dependent protease